MKLGAPRLLPIVIAAAAALFVFKAIGLVTGGGYILTGATPALAQHAESAAPAEVSASGAATELPVGANITDTTPTLEDSAVTMKLPEGAPAPTGEVTPHVGPADIAAVSACPPVDAAAEPPTGDATAAPCIPDPGVNEHGDALPLIKDNATGNLVPLAEAATDPSSEGALTERLGERRDSLDQRAKELDMRAALVEAAEKRLEERTAELKALEEKVTRLVDENKTAEQQQFVGLVAMYETMKPKDAATIFNQLDLPVLLGVSRAMNPRKMAPILARMDPMKAKALTDGLAAAETPAPTTEAAAEDLTNLPQIVGQ